MSRTSSMAMWRTSSLIGADFPHDAEHFRSVNNDGFKYEVEALAHLGFDFQYHGAQIQFGQVGNGTQDGGNGKVFLLEEAVQEIFGLDAPAPYTCGDIWDPMFGAVVDRADEGLTKGGSPREQDIIQCAVGLKEALRWRRHKLVEDVDGMRFMRQMEGCIAQLEGLCTMSPGAIWQCDDEIYLPPSLVADAASKPDRGEDELEARGKASHPFDTDTAGNPLQIEEPPEFTKDNWDALWAAWGNHKVQALFARYFCCFGLEGPSREYWLSVVGAPANTLYIVLHIHFAGNAAYPDFERIVHVNARFSALDEVIWPHLQLKSVSTHMGHRIANNGTNLTGGSRTSIPKGSLCQQWSQVDEVAIAYAKFEGTTPSDEELTALVHEQLKDCLPEQAKVTVELSLTNQKKPKGKICLDYASCGSLPDGTWHGNECYEEWLRPGQKLKVGPHELHIHPSKRQHVLRATEEDKGWRYNAGGAVPPPPRGGDAPMVNMDHLRTILRECEEWREKQLVLKNPSGLLLSYQELFDEQQAVHDARKKALTAAKKENAAARQQALKEHQAHRDGGDGHAPAEVSTMPQLFEFLCI